MQMGAKYRIDDEVIVSGTLTGIGDVEGRVTEVEFYPLKQEYFYNVKCETRDY